MTNVDFVNNSATYGPDLASYAVKIRLAGSESDEMSFDNVGPNIPNEDQIQFEILDYDNQVMVLNSVSQMNIQPVNRSVSSISGTNSVQFKNGVATYDNLVAIATPGSQNITFVATVKAIDSVKIKNVYGSAVSENTITFSFRNCKPGEYISDGSKCVE